MENFLEQMEVACISNHIEDPIQALFLLQIRLKDEAQKWLKSHEGELQRAQPTNSLDIRQFEKEALKEEFVKAEDPEKLWQEVKEVRQRERESVGDNIDRFSSLWEKSFGVLQPQASRDDKEGPIYDRAESGSMLEGGVEEAKVI